MYWLRLECESGASTYASTFASASGVIASDDARRQTGCGVGVRMQISRHKAPYLVIPSHT